MAILRTGRNARETRIFARSFARARVPSPGFPFREPERSSNSVNTKKILDRRRQGSRFPTCVGRQSSNKGLQSKENLTYGEVCVSGAGWVLRRGSYRSGVEGVKRGTRRET